jgi:hypothetical protein
MRWAWEETLTMRALPVSIMRGRRRLVRRNGP